MQCIKYDEYVEKINKWTWDDYMTAPDEIIEQVWQTIPDWKKSQEVSDGLFRRNVMSYDRDVVRELICNSLVHRSYAITGDIFINIHPDHIEIVNPGRLPYGVTPENILHKSKKRNPNYCMLMRTLKYMEVEGSGYDKMYEILLQQGKKVPGVFEGDDYVSVNVGRRIRNTKVLELTDSDALRPWLQPLIKAGLVISRNVRSRGMEYRVNSSLLKEADYKGLTSLKRIEDYRLKELIMEDLKLSRRQASLKYANA